MDDSTLETLKNEYPTASWALWSSEFPETGCIEDKPAEFFEYIKQRRDQLRPSVVLLSLNPSTELPTNYRNFHSTDPKHRNDQFRDLIEEAGLEGAYMTDLVERIINADSGNVEPTSADVENLVNQLKQLDQVHYHILCFHEKVYQALKDACESNTRELPHDIRTFQGKYDGVEIECYRVWFHANWGANQDKVSALREQLKFLNGNVINGGLSDLSQWLE